MRNTTQHTPKRLPKHGHHKPSGQGYVRIPGFKMIYTGKWGTAESESKYSQILAEWLGAERTVPSNWASSESYDITDLLFDYMEWAGKYYEVDGGKPSREIANLRLALRPLRLQFGGLSVDEFSPKKLKAYRQEMVERGTLTRETINQRVGIVKRMFDWGVAEELVSPEIGHALRVVRHLSRGRNGLRSQRSIQPVAREYVDQILPHLAPTHAAMLKILSLTGMRPGEMVQMRKEDIERGDPNIWTYQPMNHKTERFGHEREIALGPKCRKVLNPFLKKYENGFLFRPQAAFEESNRRRSENRKTKPTPQQRANIRRRALKPKRKFGPHIQVTNFARAIRKACLKAGVPPFTPNQVRHLVATEVRKEFGLDATQAILGHKRISTTQIYAQVSDDQQRMVALERG